MEATEEVGAHVPPLEVEIYWCPLCGSKFLHYLGTRHIRQNGQGGECWGRTKKIQFIR
jgi:hypothetical protein